MFAPNKTVDPEYDDSFGYRADGRNLVDEWDAMHEETNHQYVWNKEDMDAADADTTDYLLGTVSRGGHSTFVCAARISKSMVLGAGFPEK